MIRSAMDVDIENQQKMRQDALVPYEMLQGRLTVEHGMTCAGWADIPAWATQRTKQEKDPLFCSSKEASCYMELYNIYII